MSPGVKAATRYTQRLKQRVKMVLSQLVRRVRSPYFVYEQQTGIIFSEVFRQVTAESCFKLSGHRQVSTAGLRLARLDLPRGTVH
jgi:hypothetical protein